MASDIKVIIPQEYMDEMNQIKKSLSSFPGYRPIAASLGKIYPQEIVAGLVGCIIIESKTDHTIVNRKEYEGGGTSGTQGWNCGEGLIQWTFWKYKLPLIQAYNADSRSTQKLPTTWEMYKRGTPKSKGKDLCAVEDGLHIAGLTFNNQILFLTKYYENAINKLIKNGETNLAMIVAKIYQEKAGVGLMKEYSSDPIQRAYETAAKHYKSESGNTYLQSLKLAQEYLGSPVEPSADSPIDGDYENYYSKLNWSDGGSYSSSSTVSNSVSGVDNSNSVKSRTGIILGSHMKQR